MSFWKRKQECRDYPTSPVTITIPEFVPYQRGQVMVTHFGPGPQSFKLTEVTRWTFAIEIPKDSGTTWILGAMS